MKIEHITQHESLKKLMLLDNLNYLQKHNEFMEYDMHTIIHAKNLIVQYGNKIKNLDYYNIKSVEVGDTQTTWVSQNSIA